MRILTRYILGEILSHTLIGCALFTFILFMPELPHLLEVVVRNSSSLTDMAEIFLFTLPRLFSFTIPMSVLVGILLGLSRLAADSEVIAMRASGMGIGYFVRVASIVAVAGTLLGLGNSLYLAPRASQAILNMQQSLETQQASYEIQPHVFYEEFKGAVLYVQEVIPRAGVSNWRQVFMADVSDPSNPIVTTAASATVVSDNTQTLMMRLRDGARHETVAGNPDQYNISRFTTTDMPLSLSPQNDVHLGRMETVIYALPMKALIARSHGPDPRRYLIELYNRFSFPIACLVLMLVGVPLGVNSRRGGKSSGFVFTILLVFIYYFLSSTGIALGRQNKLPVFLAVWSANLLFAVVGVFLLWQMATGGRVLTAISDWMSRLGGTKKARVKPAVANGNGFGFSGFFDKLQPRVTTRAKSRGAFPRILDEYVVREFFTMFVLVLAAFVLLIIVFTFFDLVGDIIRNHIPLTTVGAYLFNLTPSQIYQITPLAVLIAALVTFGLLNRNSEIIAMKATGISLYRLVVPIVSISAILAICLFLFDQYYLPQANRRQEALRSIIKGRPPQTFLNPEQQWMFGQKPLPGESGRIFYYQLFDPDTYEFANISVFEFNPSTFELTRRIFARRAVWDPVMGTWQFEDGWMRDLQDANVTDYRTFQRATFPEIHAGPDYFKKEALESQEMNFGQLERYIRDLRQSGFDTVRLRVALWHKLAYPLVAIVMAVLAIPFALSMGRRGSLTGIAVAIGVALAYWVVNGLFEAMGGVNYLPAVLAAWSSDVLFGLIGGYLLLRTHT